LPTKKHLIETLKYYTEVFRLVWVSVLAVGGGSIGLLLGELDRIRVILALAGLMLLVPFLELLRRLNTHILQLLKKLEEDEDA
jgi:hypothetical protein